MEQGILAVVSLLLGAALGAWYTVYLRRPTLKVTGSGGGGGPGPGHHQNQIEIMNQPGLLGIRFGATIIFGKRLHGPVERGLTVDRNPANECRASLYDKKTGKHVAMLWWRSSHDPAPPLHPTVTLQSGQSATLMLFARLDDEPTKYFVFAPDPTSSGPKIPPDQAKFTESREFVIRIDYSYGRQKLVVDAAMTKEFDGRLTFMIARGGGGSF